MLYWTAGFLVLAIAIALFGMSAIAASVALVAKALFVIFIGLFMFSLLGEAMSRR